ncbi:MAG: hypothetical protein J1F29_03940 [Lentimicrobiaceae bacterium]|nr:hypothetical protein [Lentimicrobiaceae bacterium]
MSWVGKLFKRNRKTAFVDLSGIAVSDEEYNRIKHRQEVYALQLLRKISEKGKESLSKDEREFLEAYSRSNYLN